MSENEIMNELNNSEINIDKPDVVDEPNVVDKSIAVETLNVEETPIVIPEPNVIDEPNDVGNARGRFVDPAPQPVVMDEPISQPTVDELPKMEPYVEPQPVDEPTRGHSEIAGQARNDEGLGHFALDAESRPRVYDTYQFSQAAPEVKDEPKAPKKERGLGKRLVTWAAIALVFGLVSGATFLGVNAVGNHFLGNTTDNNFVKLPDASEPGIGNTEKVVETVKPEDIQPKAKAAGDVAEVAANVMPSVVSISNLSVQEVPDFFGSQKFESESSGSGIIVGQSDTELLVATNNHVVVGAKTITVTFIDMSSVEAQIKGTDADNDLAVVAVNIEDIEQATIDAIKVATIGDSSKLVVGEQVVAIGNALGYGQSVTAGYVSALDREVTVENVTANLIQTDAAINPGNSGGALLNMQGELIGINAVKFAANGVEGMGYAIPVSTAKPILDELMNRTTRFKVDAEKASYLGVTCRAITEETAQMYNMPLGVFVAEVASGTAAEKAGIKTGDIITKFGDTTIKSYNELVDALQYYEAGEVVEMVIARAEAGEYKDQTISVTLDARPAELDSQNGQGSQESGREDNPEDGQEDFEGSRGFQFPW